MNYKNNCGYIVKKTVIYTHDILTCEHSQPFKQLWRTVTSAWADVDGRKLKIVLFTVFVLKLKDKLQLKLNLTYTASVLITFFPKTKRTTTVFAADTTI